MSLHRLVAAIGAVILSCIWAPCHAQGNWENYKVTSVSVSPSALAGGMTVTITCNYAPAGSMQLNPGSVLLHYVQTDWSLPAQIYANGAIAETFKVSGYDLGSQSESVQLKLGPDYIDRNVDFGCEIDPLNELGHHSELSVTRHVAIGAYEELYKPFDFKPAYLDMRSLPRSGHATGRLRFTPAGSVTVGHRLNKSLYGGAGKNAIPTVQDGTVLQFNCEWLAVPITTTDRSIRTSGELLIDGRPYRSFPMSVSGSYLWTQDGEYGSQKCGFYKCWAKGYSGPIDWTAHGGGVHVISCRVDSDGASELATYQDNNTISTRIKVPLTASMRRPVHLPPQMHPHLETKPSPAPRLSTELKPRTTILQTPRSISNERR